MKQFIVSVVSFVAPAVAIAAVFAVMAAVAVWANDREAALENERYRCELTALCDGQVRPQMFAGKCVCVTPARLPLAPASSGAGKDGT